MKTCSYSTIDHTYLLERWTEYVKFNKIESFTKDHLSLSMFRQHKSTFPHVILRRSGMVVMLLQ